MTDDQHPRAGDHPTDAGRSSDDADDPVDPHTGPTKLVSDEDRARIRGDGGGDDHVGPYRLIAKLGEGGMGEVFEAEQTEPVRRTVALKLIKAGLDSDEVLARFDSERQALALMDHANVSRVLDVGATDQGRPYFVMEYVKGVPMTNYCDTHRLDPRARLELFIKVCDGIQHAHQKGIIHRDIKPTNVLVAVQGDRPEPKIIDFGVAKATTQRLTDQAVHTEFGQVIGTPAYMSPEQAEMSSLDIDTRSDVYSLGVLLYELLVGKLPFEPSEFAGVSFDEVRRRIREDDPPKPSTRITNLGDDSAEIAKRRATSPPALSRRLAGDLDWIVMKALEKDRTRRYASASELAADIRRHLDDEAVLAGPPGASYRLRKFVTRHRTGVVAAAAAAVVLVGFSVTVTWQSITVARERDRAQAEAARALAFKTFVEQTLLSPDPVEGIGLDASIADAFDYALSRVEVGLEGQPEAQASVLYAIGSAYIKLSRYADGEPLIRRALEIYREYPGIDDYDLGVTLRRLGELEVALGNYDDAEAAYVEALGIFNAAQADDAMAETLDDATAGTLASLGTMYYGLGRFDDAEEALGHARDVYARAGADSLEMAYVLNLLGGAATMRSDYRAASEQLAEALRIRRAELGEDHMLTVEATHNLAAALEELGDLEAAEQRYRETIAATRRIFGGDSDQVAAMIGNLGLLVEKKGHFDEAEALLREALAIDRRILGDGNIFIAYDLTNLAGFLNNRGRFEEAEAVVLEAVAIFDRSLPPTAWQVANIRSLHGAVLTGLGRYDEAEDELLPSLGILEAEFDAAHERSLRTRRRIVDLYTAWGREEDAARYRAGLPDGG